MRAARLPAWILAGLLLCVLAVVVAGAASARPTSTATNTVTFKDSIGDSSGAPDVATVVVSNDNDGLISFAIELANRQSLGSTECLWVDVDSDNNMTTGWPPFGFDYDIQYCGGQISLWRWDGQDFVIAPMTSLRTEMIAPKLTIFVSAAELGQTSAFAFGIETTSNYKDENAPYDLAPDRLPFWSYEVKLAPVLNVTTLTVTPLPAVPGKPLAAKATVSVTRGGKPEALPPDAQVVWTATLGATALPSLGSQVGADGALTASWQMPKSTKATAVQVAVSVTSEGVTATKTQDVKVLYVAPKLRVASLDCTPEPGVPGNKLVGTARVLMTRGGVPEALPLTAKAKWTATIGGRRLQPLTTKVKGGGVVTSTWKLPSVVTARTMKVTLVVTAEGVRVTANHAHKLR